MSVTRTVLLGCSLALLAGCGNTRTPVPSATQPSPPDGFRILTGLAGGVGLLDEYAPLPLFAAVEKTVFAPVQRSLTLPAPGAA